VKKLGHEAKHVACREASREGSRREATSSHVGFVRLVKSRHGILIACRLYNISPSLPLKRLLVLKFSGEPGWGGRKKGDVSGDGFFTPADEMKGDRSGLAPAWNFKPARLRRRFRARPEGAGTTGSKASPDGDFSLAQTGAPRTAPTRGPPGAGRRKPGWTLHTVTARRMLAAARRSKFRGKTD
jgi:hypothetical protein